MKVVIGIDIGGSSTKIVGFSENKMTYDPKLIKASDPLASMCGAFGKFITENRLDLKDIEKIMITGVGASYVKDCIYGIPTGKLDEFICIGLGGQYLSSLDRAVVVSMGTGTAFVSAEKADIRHIGGSGIGGGTLLGLARKLVGTTNIDNLVELAKYGDMSKVDLSIGDITNEKMSLPDYATASNFGKLNDLANNSDIAFGLLNMVLQTIGVFSYFAARGEKCRDIVLIGNLSKIALGKDIFNKLAQLFDVSFIIPKDSEYATAAGAALAYLKNLPYVSLMDIM